MAISRDSSSSGTGVSGGTITFSHTCTSNATDLFVFVQNTLGANVTGVTYNGVAMTAISNSSTAGGVTIYSYHLVNPASGTHNVVASVSSGNGCAVSVSYIATVTTGLDATGTQTNNTGVASFTESLTTVKDNSWIVMGVANNNGSTGTSGFSAASGCASVASTSIATTTWRLGVFDSNGAETPAGSKSFGINIQTVNDAYTTQMISVAPAFVLDATKGSYSLNGKTLSPILAYNMSPATAFFNVFGKDAQIIKSGDLSTWSSILKDNTSFSGQSKTSSTWSSLQSSDIASIWAHSTLPWQLALPWQHSTNVKESIFTNQIKS